MSTDRGMNREDVVVHIYNRILLSHKEEKNNAICSNIDGPTDGHTEWHKSEKDKYHMIPFIHEIEKSGTNKFITKQKQNYKCRKPSYR